MDETLVLGAGPAGLTAAYLLGKAGEHAVVLEADRQVGGLAKTVEIDGYRFDLGGHRFFTKAWEVEALWNEIMGDEFLLRPRMSRIYWNKKFLDYPLRGPDVVRKLGPVELARCIASYLKAAVLPKRREESLEDWVSNRFGRRLFELFFKSYTEKVWGADDRDPRRMGCAADQRTVVLLGREGGVLWQPRQQGEDADLGVPLSALRPRPDVGDDDATDRRAGW